MTETIGCARVTGAVISEKPSSATESHPSDFPTQKEIVMNRYVAQ